MFSGIVHKAQKIKEITKTDSGALFVLELADDLIDGLHRGASVAVSGVCLTVTNIDGNHVSFDLTNETLERTTLGDITVGSLVNIERSLKMGDEIGGHVLSGHVMGTVTISSITEDMWHFSVPNEFVKYLFTKGYVALDGCSLTIVEVDRDACRFSIAYIPETLERTTFGIKHIGDSVNLEIDGQTQAVVETVESMLQKASS